MDNSDCDANVLADTAMASSSPLRWILYPLASGIVLFGLMSAAGWYPVQPFAAEELSRQIFTLEIAALMGLLLLTLATLLGCIAKATRRRSALLFLCACCAFGGAIVGLRYGNVIRMEAFADLAERSKPLISAIKAYEKTEGHPPNVLDDLVPRYFPAVPSTGIGAYPDYQYVRFGENDPLHGNAWKLEVPCSLGPMNFDHFVYHSSEDYTDAAFYDVCEKVGAWAYVAE